MAFSKKSKKYGKCIFLICFTFVLGACGQTDSESGMTMSMNEAEGAKEAMTISVDYLCKEFGIEESEFDGVDLEEFLAYYELTPDNISDIFDEDLGFLLRMYKKDEAKVKIPNYERYSSENDTVTLTQEKAKNIKILVWKYAHGEEQDYVVIDFENGNVFWGCGTMQHLTKDDIVGIADAALKEDVLALFQEYSIYDWWQPSYTQTYAELLKKSEGFSETFNFSIVYEDETVSNLWGIAVTGEDAPGEIGEFIEKMKSCVK